MNLSEKEMKQEKAYLDATLDVIRGKISKLGQELYEREDKVQEFQKFIWDSKADMDPTEMKNMILANDTEVMLMQNKGKYLQKLYRIQDNPYFGSMTFQDEDEQNKIYIGITHVEDEENDIYLVNDWRSPICSMFYDYEVGPAKYKAPGGEVEGEILCKRQFNIKDGKIVRVFDNNLNIDDELLQEVLATESSDKMKNIVNTIQQEQNAIIRNIEDKNLIVQGIAGSGKTSVALHRIAFLLYKIENLTSNNVLIFSPNQIFSEYISNVLPELGEDNTMQTTFHDFLTTYTSEFKDVESFTNFIERYYKYTETNEELVRYKQSDQVITDLNNYVKDFIDKAHFTEDIVNKDYSITKEELDDLLKDRFNKMLFFERLDLIGEKLSNNYYNGNKSKARSIRSQLVKILNTSLDFKTIYKNFFYSKFFKESFKGTITDEEIDEMIKRKTINYEDACLFTYLKSLLKGFDYRGMIKQVVIDEAQDYSKLQYIIIKNIFKKANFTILGDINQTINPYYKYDSLEILKDVFKSGTNYLELRKTYRSSPEIIEHTNKILGLNHVSAIRKSENKPVIFRDETNLKDNLINDVTNLKKVSKSVAIITKTDDESEYLYELLKKDIPDLSLLNSNSVGFNKEMIVIPSYVAKGLEFDSAIIYTDKINKYKETEKYLYYVACTRSQHQLIIYNQK
ncbi:MAG: AAA family ATPase [Bacilli bacterium]|nr:AAA family ATPase [Bacilli bacterium]